MSIIDIVQKLKTDTALAKSVAAACGITPNAIRHWDKVPIGRVPAVESVTGIPRHLIRPDRPDMFPVPIEVASARGRRRSRNGKRLHHA